MILSALAADRPSESPLTVLKRVMTLSITVKGDAEGLSAAKADNIMVRRAGMLQMVSEPKIRMPGAGKGPDFIRRFAPADHDIQITVESKYDPIEEMEHLIL
ncbi:hypothetical protein QVD17_38025 [Tagetes erecta]|uniref:Uncharacterized protein n=1 Tax=Tagetes erecta TaxID=13708 RepID=A0AAD8JZC8_TARER|nr:hypothetical protein QVD17_38025 [Tagetes erecta]